MKMSAMVNPVTEVRLCTCQLYQFRKRLDRRKYFAARHDFASKREAKVIAWDWLTSAECLAFFRGWRSAMAKVNLSQMTVEALMDLRKRIDEVLLQRRAEIQKQLDAIAMLGGERVARKGRRASALKGRKVPPKYRGPSGETWAGRGARPLWLVAAIKGGKKLDDFLIDKSARKGRKR